MFDVEKRVLLSVYILQSSHLLTGSQKPERSFTSTKQSVNYYFDRFFYDFRIANIACMLFGDLEYA